MSLELPGPVVVQRRTPGEIRLAALDAGEPPITIAFVIPDGLMSSRIEAEAARALAAVRLTPATLARYGLTAEGELAENQLAALSRLVTAVESAILLWRDWNIHDPPPDEGGAPVKRGLTSVNIAELLSDTNLRAAWMVQLDAASPLDRSEGNVFAASPNGSSEEAADTAKTAESPDTPAPTASPDVGGGSAPG